MYDDVLPVTGGAALVLGSYSIDLPWFITIAAGLVVVGFVVYRVATRSARREQG